MIAAPLLAIVVVPLVAAVLTACMAKRELVAWWTSLIASAATLLVGASVAWTIQQKDQDVAEAWIQVPAWRISPVGTPTTIAIGLPKEWSAAPMLVAAGAVLIFTNRPRHGLAFIHLQHAFAQAALVANTPKLALAAVSMSTTSAIVTVIRRWDGDAWRANAVAVRWLAADALLWIWLVGLLGHVDRRVVAIALPIALALRIGLFPFHSGLLEAVHRTDWYGLLLLPLPPLIWSCRWLAGESFLQSPMWTYLAMFAALAAAAAALSERHWTARRAYELAAVWSWPVAFPTSVAGGVAMCSVGSVAVLAPRSTGFQRVASIAMVLCPSVLLSFHCQSGPIAAAAFLGWMCVSVSAVLIRAGSAAPVGGHP